jgi:hypothetical protein
MNFQQADDIFKAFFGGQDPFAMFFENGGKGGGMPGFGGPGGPRMMFQVGKGGMGGMGGMPFMFDMGGGMPGMGMPGMASRGGKGAPPRTPIPAYALPENALVTVRGLQKAPEHNGKTGRITAWDEQKARYEVSLERNETLSLRPSNLTQRCRVEITGIASQPAMNGQLAEVINFTEENSRYMVKLDAKPDGGKDVIGVKPDNVIMQKGTRVVVTGLSNEQFNGQMAQIVDVDRAGLRYTVQLQSGKQIKIKLENVLC